jgi:hypothetical protein
MPPTDAQKHPSSGSRPEWTKRWTEQTIAIDDEADIDAIVTALEAFQSAEKLAKGVHVTVHGGRGHKNVVEVYVGVRHVAKNVVHHALERNGTQERLGRVRDRGFHDLRFSNFPASIISRSVFYVA